MKNFSSRQLVKIVSLLIFSVFNMVLTSSANSSVVYQSDCVRGNGKIKTVTRDVLKFNIVELDGAFDVKIVSGKSNQVVKITADENILTHIKTSIQGNRLEIYPSKSICTENSIQIDIAMSDLQGIVSSGSDDIKATGINSLSFSLIQGGSGDMELQGRTNNLNAELSGSGDLNAQFLKTEKATLRLNGSSTANVHASEVLDVGVTGVAEVNYFGNPKRIIKDIVGIGELNPMD